MIKITFYPKTRTKQIVYQLGDQDDADMEIPDGWSVIRSVAPELGHSGVIECKPTLTDLMLSEQPVTAFARAKHRQSFVVEAPNAALDHLFLEELIAFGKIVMD